MVSLPIAPRARGCSRIGMGRAHVNHFKYRIGFLSTTFFKYTLLLRNGVWLLLHVESRVNESTSRGTRAPSPTGLRCLPSCARHAACASPQHPSVTETLSVTAQLDSLSHAEPCSSETAGASTAASHKAARDERTLFIQCPLNVHKLRDPTALPAQVNQAAARCLLSSDTHVD